MEKTIKCEYCREEMPQTKTYAFFEHKSGRWHEGHSQCMNILQFEIDYRARA